MKSRKESTPLGLAIRSIRARLGETQREFSRRFGLSGCMVSRFESGSVVPSVAILRLLAQSAERPEEMVPILDTIKDVPSNLDRQLMLSLQIDRLQNFLYVLLRDHLTLGQMEEAFIEADNEADRSNPMIAAAVKEYSEPFIAAATLRTAAVADEYADRLCAQMGQPS